ncbi:MAG: ADP-ribosylglycohydrolase family protein [Oscillospiraceae bacterium]|nr:ADP-ribosylglycohydrolase family protein [Oscillospiraceae bacterium]
MRSITTEERFYGCMLGGALGDALGYPVEFMNTDEIEKLYGRNGITAPKIDKAAGSAIISDDTQMTLFTAEGIIWADRLGGKTEVSSYTTYVFYAYQRWLYTQEKLIASREYAHVIEKNTEFSSRLLNEAAMYSRRAPGSTCISALKQAAGHNYGKLTHKINDSKGCGGVMRVAPAGLYFYRDSERAFRMAAEFAAITHTHDTGFLAAGALGALIAELTNGADLYEAADVAMYILKGYNGCMETYRALDHARSLDAGDVSPVEAVARLGQGWIAEEALAIALYCAMCHCDKPENALRLAVNHNGDSDSTGAICGNIIGAYRGAPALPYKWLKKLELGEVIEELSGELYKCCMSADGR